MGNKEIDDREAIKIFEQALWPNGPICPKCKSQNVYKMKTTPRPKWPSRDRMHRCHDCRKAFTVTTGTHMHGSHIPPHKWIQAYLTVIDDPKITSKKLAGLVGISYVGAWKIRRIVREEIREDKKLETEIQQALDELVKEGKVIIIKEHEDPAERVYQNVRTP